MQKRIPTPRLCVKTEESKAFEQAMVSGQDVLE